MFYSVSIYLLFVLSLESLKQSAVHPLMLVLEAMQLLSLRNAALVATQRQYHTCASPIALSIRLPSPEIL